MKCFLLWAIPLSIRKLFQSSGYNTTCLVSCRTQVPCCTACSSLFQPGNLSLLVNSTDAPSSCSLFSISPFTLVFKCCSFSLIPCIRCRCPDVGRAGQGGCCEERLGLPRARHGQFQLTHPRAQLSPSAMGGVPLRMCI